MPGKCVYESLLSMHLTPWTTDGGPLLVQMAEGWVYVTSTRDRATSYWNRTGSKCIEAPRLHQRNMPSPDRTNYTARIVTRTTPSQNKLTLPLNRSAHTPRAKALLLRWMQKRNRVPDYSFGPVCFHLPTILYHIISSLTLITS